MILLSYPVSSYATCIGISTGKVDLGFSNQTNMADPQPIKCVLVGPPRCGKTRLLLNLTTGEGTDDSFDYSPTFFDIYETSIEHDGQMHQMR